MPQNCVEIISYVGRRKVKYVGVQNIYKDGNFLPQRLVGEGSQQSWQVKLSGSLPEERGLMIPGL